VNDPKDFAHFVAALPRELEPDLILGETVSTPFFEARRAGWPLDQLVADAQATCRRGLDRPVGAIIRRLETLATKQPADRIASVVPIHRSRWSAAPGQWCPCTMKPAHRIPVPLTGDQAVARHALLREAEALDPDTAEQRMAALIASQNAPGGSW
jgi:hypothetical protein